MPDSLTLKTIQEARERIRPYILHTQLLPAERLGERLGCNVYLKPEMLQLTGSFKARGALSKSLTLTSEERSRGLIASSSGNHAQALAYAGRLIGAATTLVVPINAPAIKVESTRALGAEVVLFDGPQAARWAHVDDLIAEHGYTMVHASEDPLVMAGQGTIALEILEDLPDVDTIVVPLGGGGLLSGIATAAKALNPRIRVIGVEPAQAPKFRVSRERGERTSVPVGDTIADGVREEIPGQNALPIIERTVDELVLADDVDTISALRMLVQDVKVFPEGAAAVGIGAALAGRIRLSPTEKVCFVLSGGNWAPEALFEVLQASENKRGA